MYCNIKEGIDIEERDKLRAPEAIQFVITLYFFLGSLLLKWKYQNCGWEWKIWVDFVFFGSLIWLAYLLITLVGKYKSRDLRSFFRYVDIFWFVFLVAMWIWLVVIIAKDEYFDKCNDAVDLFGTVFLVLGSLAFLLVLIGLIGVVFKLIRPKDNISTNAHDVAFQNNYDEDVDFNPYQ